MPQTSSIRTVEDSVRKATAAEVSDHRGATLTSIDVEDSQYSVMTTAKKCRIVWGTADVWILVIIGLASCGLYAYVFMAHGGLPTAYTFIFLGFSILLGALSIAYIAKAIWMVLSTPGTSRKRIKTTDSRTCCDKRCTMPICISNSLNFLQHVLAVNGKYYLIKLHILEFVEHLMQAYNYNTVYTCQMEPWAVRTILFLFVSESTFTAYNMYYMHSSAQRNRQVVVDLVLDFVSVVFAPLLSWFVFGVPVGVGTMLQIAFLPTCAIISTLVDLWCEHLRIAQGNINHVWEMQSAKTRRLSILFPGKSGIHAQLKTISRNARLGILLLNIGFAMLFAALGVVNIALSPSAEACQKMHTSELWNGCRVRVPFCQTPFEGRCDCAVVQILNYSKAEFPDSFGNMSSLLKLGVYTGQLEQLPTTLGEDHKRLVHIDVLKNELRELPQSIVKIEGLIVLSVNRNELTSLPDDIGRLTNLIVLSVNGNELTSLPDDVTMLINLQSLDIGNNNITALPHRIGDMAALRGLYARFNRLRTLPRSLVDLRNLNVLYLGNNTLVALPESFGHLEELVVVDLAMNALHKLPSSVENLRNIVMFDVMGNPLCSRSYDFPANLLELKTEGLCRRRCSPSCPESWKGDGFCDDNHYTYDALGVALPDIEPVPNSGCNTASCEFDGGDCPAPH